MPQNVLTLSRLKNMLLRQEIMRQNANIMQL